MRLFEELEALEAMEQRYGLAHWKIDGCYIWKLLRWRAFTDHLIGKGVIPFPHPRLINEGRAKKSKNQKIFLKLNKIKSKILHDFQKKRARSIVAYSSGRLVSFNGKIIDRSCVRLASLEAKHVVFVENSSRLRPKPGAPERVSPKAILDNCKNNKLKREPKLSASDRSLLAVLQKILSGTKIHEHRLLSTLIGFQRRKIAFRVFLRERKIKQAFLVCGYNKEFFIEACRELSISVSEIQHGVLGRGHTGYDFKEWEKVPYFPDRFLAFGRAWPDTCHFPTNVKIEVSGDPFLKEKREAGFAKFERNPSLLLVLSQATVSNLLREVVCEFLSVNSEYCVVWRSHPNEDPGEIKTFFQHSGFGHRVECDSETALVEQACKSSVAIGVYTTALLEAMYCGCKGCVVEHEGGFHEFYRGLIRERKAGLIGNGRELMQVIKSLPAPDVEEYLVNRVISDEKYFGVHP